MPQITLADIASAADKKFGDLEIVTADGSTLTFSNPMRLSKDKRRELALIFNLQERAKTHPEDDQWDLYNAALKIVAKTEADFTGLETAIGDDPAVWEGIFNEFESRTDAGEASPSAG